MIGALLAVGSTRVIAYNFGEGQSHQADGRNYDNEVYLYNSSVVHEIKIGLDQEDYDRMIATYLETGEKEFFKTDVTIDGVTIPDVGVRLKGNSSLSQTVGGGLNGPGGPGGNNGRAPRNGPNGDGMPQMPDGAQPPAGFQRPAGQPTEGQPPEGFDPAQGMPNMGASPGMDMDLPDNWQDMTQEDRQKFLEENGMPAGGGPMGGGGPMEGATGGNPPLLIKIDEFDEGQTYQGFVEIAVRTGSIMGSDKSLLAEPVALSIHSQAGQVVPEVSYAVVQTAEKDPSLYVICEEIDEIYVEKNFPGVDSVLYKAGNFIGFEYLGDDPTLYTDKFEQKTGVNDDDLAPLIRFLKFVSESSDAEFESQLPQWLDIDSFIRLMALDNLLSNNDSFGGMGSNYFLLYDKEAGKFTMLSWDMNLAMGSMSRGPGSMSGGPGGMAGGGQQMGGQFGEGNPPNGQGAAGFGPRGGQSQNVLKNRFFANEKFSKMYDTEYERLKALIFDTRIAGDKLEEFIRVFTDYNAENNVMDQNEYDSGVERIKSFLNL